MVNNGNKVGFKSVDWNPLIPVRIFAAVIGAEPDSLEGRR